MNSCIGVWGCMVLSCVGMSIVVDYNAHFWDRLLGLQVMMMGGYLITFIGSLTPSLVPVLAHLFQVRLLLVIAEMIWIGIACSSLWWCITLLITLSIEYIWILFILTRGYFNLFSGCFSFKSRETSKKTSKRIWRGTSRTHNFILGMIPLGEGIGILGFGTLYAPLVLGVNLFEQDDLSAGLFGLHTLYLAYFWMVTVTSKIRQVLIATVIGRIGVAIAFITFQWVGVVDYKAHLIWLAPLLIGSSIWTAIEVRGVRRN